MNIDTMVKRAALTSLVALAGMAGATTAGAQAAGSTGVAVEAAGKSPRLAYTVQPGSVINGAVVVRNAAKRPAVVRLAAVDVGTAPLGGAIYGKVAGRRIGSWVTLGARAVTVPGDSARKVNFTVRVPSDARPGAHYAGITAMDAAQAAGRKGTGKAKNMTLHRITRFALPIKVRIPGPVSPKLSYQGSKVAVDARGAKVLVRLRNPGGTLIRSTTVNLRLRHGTRTVAAARQPLMEFVPDTAAKYPVALAVMPVEGDYRLVGEIRPAGAPVVKVDDIVHIDGKKVKQTQRSIVGRTAPIPARSGSPLIWVALGGVSLLALALLLAFVRMRRRLRDAESATRG
jgi:hypothetical protein